MKAIRENRRGWQSSGFTLLEILLSLSITSIIVVVIFGAFRVSIRAWEKSAINIEKQQRLRVVTQLIRRQLASAVASESLAASTGLDLFHGTESQLTFFSSIALDPRNNGSLVFSQFSATPDAEGMTLSLVERALSVAGPAIDTGSSETEEHVPLFTGLNGIRFRYLDKPIPGEDWEWDGEWRSTGPSRLPAAVKIELKDSSSSLPIVLIIPIRSKRSA